MIKELHLLHEQLKHLTVFRGLLADPVLARMEELLAALEQGDPERTACVYADFVSTLYRSSDNLSEYIRELVLESENPYILESCRHDMSTSPMKKALDADLATLQQIAGVTPDMVRRAVGGSFAGLFPAEWSVSELDLPTLYEKRIGELFTRGYGMFARHHVFMVEDGKLVPVRYPDEQRLSQLTDYERERQQVIQNTLALLSGEPASNVLLYGDAGTGKSSTIKAVANEYRDRGLRLIEVKKNQLYQIPELLETISQNPLKFILFIDDLSFSSNDSDFAALKAILEGSVAGRSKNLAVYATSNRRHLIKESFSDRQGDDIHLNDTRQELMSLSARFGLVITFQKPDKTVYLNIVRNLAKEYGIEEEPDRLEVRAEAFAIRNGGRSPRTAKQFIELVKAGVQ